ncbi:MAG: NAD(P)/FAD-dependent oxidoreductase [Gammaproteobacteria bacterium]
MQAQQAHYDIIIAGGGPAGSAAATILAQYGYRVLLIERDRHPRFHIGESMMPRIAPIMQRLNLDWSEGNLLKGGADFIDEKTGKRIFFPFQGIYRTYQIERSAFDEKMFENAAKHGAATHQQEKVLQADCREDGVLIATDKALYHGRYFIDATGRSAFMGRKHGTVKRLENLGRYAVYQHYQLAENPAVEALFATGNIEILLHELGWNWVIPLIGRRLSVGLVVKNDTPPGVSRDDLFRNSIAASPLLNALLQDAAALSDIRAEAEFSYVNQQRYGRRYACCGDAGGFLDPIFSSGFFFAVKTAEMVADRIHQGFCANREADPQLHTADDGAYLDGFQTMHLMIERFYRSGLVHNLFFEAERQDRIKQEITAILAGDLWCAGNAFQRGLLQGRRQV